LPILSVLDQSPVREGGTPAQALSETVRLAQACERFGYHRYWLAEHHNAEGLAGTAPEILIARVAAATQTMRVGSGGVMLPHYSALKVAENFRMLETLFPGRIDLGLGRAPGSDQLTALALQQWSGVPNQQTSAAQYFPNQIRDIMGWLSGRLPATHPFAQIKAQPTGDTVPELWLLGSSDHSAAVAAHFGCAFSFAHFITDQGGVEVMRAYKDAFKPSAVPGIGLARPRGSIGVFVLCAETEAAAKRLAASRDLWRLRLDLGRISAVPPVEEAEAAMARLSPAELRRVEFNRRRQIIGTPDQVKEKLLALGADYGVDEFVVVSICYDFAARVRSYELLAEAFGLGKNAPAQAAQ